MTDITELAQRMKTAAEKLDADQWQTRKGFSGIEVIVKGSLEKGHGCVSFQPVAADMADTKTARAIALFSPANVLALVEALEKARQRIEELESDLSEWTDCKHDGATYYDMSGQERCGRCGADV
ncbi:TPA: ead/Ea22-like family protein [Klebsiella pneumoniae]